MNKLTSGVFLGLAAAMLATSAMAADDPKTKRAELRKMCDTALADLYKAKPEVKAVVALTQGLTEREGVLIYPEGTRSTAQKLARAIAKI